MSISTRRISRAQQYIAESLAFTGSVIPFSDPEIVNSGRGQHLWLEVPADPVGWPVPDTYYRDQTGWRDFEPSQGVYDFTKLDQLLASTAARGGRMGFRVMPWYSPDNDVLLVPDYVPRQGTTNMPDWNSPIYLNAWTNLWAAIGAHIGSDKRLFYVDIGGYGAWGEWWWEAGYPGVEVTEANGHLIIDAVVNAMPNHFVLAPAFSPWIDYAMSLSTRVGNRYDWLGGQELSYNGWAVVEDRWKYAPSVSEWGNNIPQSGATVGLHNVQDLHFSHISSGNHPWLYADLSAQQLKDDFLMANMMAGYRISLDTVALPALYAGQTAQVQLTFTNHGVAPTYDPWRTELVFAAQGQADIHVDTGLNLRTLLPGTQTFTVDVAIPAGLRGNRTVSVAIVDPAAYLPNMRLATVGRDANGMHPLGAIYVG